MKKKLLFLLTISLLVLFNACSEDDGNEPTDPGNGDETAAQYYPGGVGSTYHYDGTSTDSNDVQTAYRREAAYTETQTQNGTQYTLQTNIITAGPAVTSGEFLFRTTSTGMFIYIDPAIFGELLDSSGIDPSLVTIEADPELRLIAFPFSTTTTWDAFIVKASALGGIINLNILELKGNYQGQETVVVTGSNMTAEKVEYTATLRIPESINDIANPQVITLSATAWFVKDVGLVKMQGSGLILNAFGSGDINFESEGSSVVETLTSYTIQ